MCITFRLGSLSEVLEDLSGLVFPMSVSVSGGAVYRDVTQCSVRCSQGREASQSLPQHSGSPSAHYERLLPARALLQCQGEKTHGKTPVTNEAFHPHRTL